ncbi:MAG: alpha-2-macroglobulin family protein [Bacteroidales bacterium]|nr:alpha-2-macroglobulin family protein [Bacteroidales bacterium]
MKSKSFLLLLIYAMLTTCSGDKKIKLIDKNFDEEIPVKALLSFTFSEDLVPDSIVGVWTDKEYIKIDPSVEGKFHWQNKNTLVFAPAESFLPATNYSAKYTDKIFKYVKKGFSGDKQFSFHTPFLEILSSHVFWNLESESSEPFLKADIEFNYDIQPDKLSEFLSIEIDNQPGTYEIRSKETGDIIEAVITGIKAEDKDFKVMIKIGEGLTPVAGSENLGKEYQEKIDVPSPYKLNITDIQANHDGNEGSILVYTTQMVEQEEIKKYISIDPAIRYKVDVQSGYFTIQSENFSIDSKYDLVIKKGLPGKIGGQLKYDYSQPVSFGKVKPTIRFIDQKEFYVSGKGSRNVQVALIGVPRVTVKVTKIYENNIISYLRNSNSYYYDEYYYDDYYYYSYNDPGNLGDVIYEKEIETGELPRKGSNRLLNFDFEDKLAQHKGIYVVEIKSPDDYWLRASKMIAISDIGLIVKQGKNSVSVFANSIKSADPIAGATIRFIGQNNQVTHTAKTNADGVAVYEYDELKAPGFRTSIIAAQLNDDYNVIPLNKTRINTSRFDVGGKRQNESGFDAFIYGDRNLYRPGETVHISCIIRDYEWKSPGSVPVILKFITPTGKTYKTIRKTLNNEGSFETDIELLTSAGTGSYIANIYTTNNVLIGSQIIKVEEFMPDRIKVDIELNKKEFKPGEQINLDISAVNFFGPPAANRNYEVELTTSRMNFYPKKNSEYSYYIEGARSSFSDIYREGTTNDEGSASQAFFIPREYKNMGVLKSDIFVTVFDETGRPVNRLKRINIYTQDVFYGVRSDDYYIKTGSPVKFELIAVDKEGNALENTEARVKLIKHEYKTVLSKSGDYFRYRSEKVEKVLKDEKMILNGKLTHFTYIPDLSGEYELRVSAPGVSTYANCHIYAYGWGSTSFSSFKVNNEGQIDIETDKEKYKVGERANVILKTPFTGKVLVTLESDKVIDYFYIETDKRAASFTIDMKDEYLPGFYISATLFKAHSETDIPLTVAHGIKPVKVDNPDYKMPVEITAVDKSRSNTSQTITVKSKPNSKITIAAVDEGILQVAGYSTPASYDYFYQKRALEVSSSNIYPYLFPEVGMTRSQTGGGEGEMMEKRLNPIQGNRVKLVSFWSGILETNSKGEAKFDIDIPQFSGDLRIMAVGYTGQIFGSKHTNMKVADPLVMSVALPRFMSPGDKLIVPVILTNTTAKEEKCRAQIEISGPVKINGENAATVSIPANSEAELLFEVEALKEIGPSEIKIVAKAMGEEFVNTTDIAVRPASPLQKRFGSGSVKAGSSKNIELDINKFIESSIDGKLVISKNPLVEFSNSLDYLVRYPYGCVEQTVSAAFPQLYFSQLLGNVYSESRAKPDAVKNVQLALDRIKLMQLYNGGLTYWPGHGTETWWGTVYAAHFTLEAKKAGYDVDEDFLNLMLKYIKKRLQKKETVTYYYNRSQRKQIAPKEVAYSLYVLTLTGEKPTSLLNYYRTRTEQLSIDSKYLIAGAYALIGDKDNYKEMLPYAFEGEISVTSFGGSFYSYIRDEAIALNVLLEVDKDNPQVGVMAKHISEQLKTKRYLNTQERTFGFLAMGKIAKMAAESTVKGTVKTDGRVIGSFDNNTLTLSDASMLKGSITVSTEGSGRVYYYWETEGITKDGSYLEEDSYITVRKQFYDRNGRPVNDNSFVQNDLVLVEISIYNGTERLIENVAITDILPACFEIENPRLTVLPPGLNYPHQRDYPEYLDIRDDRINMFTTLHAYSTYDHYYYLVRVVSVGTYNMGPISADAMYDGEYHSYNGSGIITVKRK